MSCVGLWMPITDTMEALEGPCFGLVRSSESLVDIMVTSSYRFEYCIEDEYKNDNK